MSTQRQDTSESSRSETSPHAKIAGVIEATGDLAKTTITEMGGVAESLVTTAGRVGTTAVTEVFNVVSNIAGGVSHAVGSLLAGRTQPPPEQH